MKKVLLVLIILCGVLSLQFFLTHYSQADGTYSSLGTGDSSDGSNDAINFSQGRVWTIDAYGKYIWLTQNRTGTTTHFVWSNDLGATWTEGSESYGALTRGSIAYDSVNDILHVIWNATDTNDGVIYRRYSITRNGSNNITSIQRIDSGTINLQLDTSATRSLEQPVALWVNDGTTYGSLVALWLKEGASMTEIRGSMRKLSMNASDGIASNWQALDNSEDTFLTDPPLVPADKIYGIGSSSRVAASAFIRGGSGARKDDIYVFVAAANSNNVLAYRGIWNSVNTDWRTGWQAPITLGGMDTSSGYSLKEQLITKPVLDNANDRIYVGWARWKSGGEGDTVSVAYLSNTDTPSSTIDIYSANGTHSYAPTVDIAFDQTLGQLYVAYVESTTNGTNGSIDYKTYDGSSLSTSTRFYTSPGGANGADGGADIPILYENRTSNGRLLFAFRVNGALPPNGTDPHTINWGYITLAQPSNTPTPIPSQQSSSGSSFSSSTNTVSGCTAQIPLDSPHLFQVNVSDTKATLFFAPITSAHSHYQVMFGYTPSEERFSADITKGTGVISYTLNNLSPQTVYYVRIRGMNTCMPGPFSNEMKILTSKKGNTKLVPVYGSSGVGNLNTSCSYTVMPGDSLAKIAKKKLGNSKRYKEIIDANKNTYTSLERNTVIRRGWVLRVGC